MSSDEDSGSVAVPMEVDASSVDVEEEEATAPSPPTMGLGGAPSIPLGQVALKKASTDPVTLDQSRCETKGVASNQNLTSLSAAMGDFQPSVAMLRKHWEGYVIDGKGMQFDSFKRFFGGESEPSDTFSEIKGMIEGGTFYTPHALRHTHSTPLKKAPSILDEYAVRDGMPPPIPLNPFQRSSSTPSAFRTRSVNSAFGSVRSTLTADTEEDCSLAGVQYVSMEGEPVVSYRCSAFDPVQYYARQLEDMAVQEDMERTTIEVTDETMHTTDDSSTVTTTIKRRPKRGAAVAERFLANVRVFRRRRRGHANGRSTSFRSSSSTNSLTRTDGVDNEERSLASVPPQTMVTVITEIGETTPDPPCGLQPCASPSHTDKFKKPVCEEEPLQPVAPSYDRLESDVEEDAHYQKIEASLQTDSTQSVPSPSMQDMSGDHVQGDNIRIQVSGKKTPPFSVYSPKDNTSPVPFSTPPCQRVPRSLESALTQRSNDSMTDSPQTNRSSNTGSSMGHTTQATSSSSVQQSNLSTISETDREVMLANKEGKRRRGLDSLQVGSKLDLLVSTTSSVNSSSTSSNSTGATPHGYLALQANPSPRDGANVAMERFFSHESGQPAIAQAHVHSLENSSSSRNSGQSNSPVTDGSSTMTHTSSLRSSPSEPSTFVSHLYDKKNASDLTTREETESLANRSAGIENEEREGSPAPIVSYHPFSFEGAALLLEQQMIPKPLRPPSRPDKFRSRPPRSPVKGSRMVTTPPPYRTSPSYRQLSPPLHAADNVQQNASQPYVLRSTETGKSLVSVDQHSSAAQVDDGSLECMQGVTYEEHSIEIMKSVSKDEVLPRM
jgi:hypothetical protein